MIKVWTKSGSSDRPHEYADGQSVGIYNEGHVHVMNEENDTIAIYAPGTWVRAVKES